MDKYVPSSFWDKNVQVIVLNKTIGLQNGIFCKFTTNFRFHPPGLLIFVNTLSRISPQLLWQAKHVNLHFEKSKLLES